MACLGVLFSVDHNAVYFLKGMPLAEHRVEYVQEFIEEPYFETSPQWVAELDKSWDALHRSLTNGRLEWAAGEYPLSHVILGGEVLVDNGSYIITLKTKEQVADIAAAIAQLQEGELRERYFRIDAKDYGDLVSEDDFDYTWQWFAGSKAFWQLAAAEGRSVLFTVDQ